MQPFQAPVRLVLVGAVHIAQPLASMATRVGFEVTVVDPRSSFASEARFPGVALRAQWPDEALRELALDRRSALLTLTHDPKLDDPALAAALRSECFYVGALGSRKNHAARLVRLRKAGFGDTDLARIHGAGGTPDPRGVARRDRRLDAGRGHPVPARGWRVTPRASPACCSRRAGRGASGARSSCSSHRGRTLIEAAADAALAVCDDAVIARCSVRSGKRSSRASRVAHW